MRTPAPRARRWILLAIWLLVAAQATPAYGEDDRDRDGYLFATTRGLTESDVHPALKVPALPVVLLIDLLFLPFAAVADAMSGNP